VDDVVSAYQLLVNQQNALEAGFFSVDLGSGKPVSIKEFTSLVYKLSKSKSKLTFGALPYRKGEIMHSSADLDSLTRLGWHPRVSLGVGIQHTLRDMKDWKQANLIDTIDTNK
jgi:nucleoside-diphosphate-sugar epimerase